MPFLILVHPERVPCPTGAIADLDLWPHASPLDRLSAEHAGCADEWLPRMAAALGACLVHAAHHAEYAASTLCGLSKSLHSTTIAASFCDEALCATVWQVLHQGSSLMDAVWW